MFLNGVKPFVENFMTDLEDFLYKNNFAGVAALYPIIFGILFTFNYC